MQDVHLGLLVALLPALAGRRGVAPAKANSGAVHSLLGGHDNASNPGTKYFTCALISGPTTKELNTYFFLMLFQSFLLSEPLTVCFVYQMSL